MFTVSAFTRRNFAHETGFCWLGFRWPDCNVIAEQGGGPDARPSWAGSGPRAGGCPTLTHTQNRQIRQLKTAAATARNAPRERMGEM